MLAGLEERILYHRRYQSTVMGSYQTMELIDTFINYQESIKRCVCIIFDPQQAKAGALGLKAVRLRDSFIEVQKAGNITAEKLKAANVSFRDIFEEIPVKVHNSALSKAVIAALEPEASIRQSSCDRLSLNALPGLERSLTFLNDCLEDVVTEQQKVSYLCIHTCALTAVYPVNSCVSPWPDYGAHAPTPLCTKWLQVAMTTLHFYL